MLSRIASVTLSTYGNIFPLCTQGLFVTGQLVTSAAGQRGMAWPGRGGAVRSSRLEGGTKLDVQTKEQFHSVQVGYIEELQEFGTGEF